MRLFPANFAVSEIEPFRGAVTVVLNRHAVVIAAVLRATRLVFSLASTVTSPVQPSAFVTVLGSCNAPEILNGCGDRRSRLGATFIERPRAAAGAAGFGDT